MTSTIINLLPAPFAWIEIPNKGYNLAKYPITNAQYSKFTEAGGYHERQWWTEAGWQACQGGGWKAPREVSKRPPEPDQAEHPVVGVSWYEAVAFCHWLSETTDTTIQLPTNEHWLYAAQDDDNRAYPWGNTWDNQRCQNSVPKRVSLGTASVHAHEGLGDSPFGVVDMAGNVFEWCLTDYYARTNDETSNAEYRLMRGGSWKYDNPADFRCDQDFRFPPARFDDGIGFRICRV